MITPRLIFLKSLDTLDPAVLDAMVLGHYRAQPCEIARLELSRAGNDGNSAIEARREGCGIRNNTGFLNVFERVMVCRLERPGILLDGLQEERRPLVLSVGSLTC